MLTAKTFCIKLSILCMWVHAIRKVVVVKNGGGLTNYIFQFVRGPHIGQTSSTIVSDWFGGFTTRYFTKLYWV